MGRTKELYLPGDNNRLYSGLVNDDSELVNKRINLEPAEFEFISFFSVFDNGQKVKVMPFHSRKEVLEQLSNSKEAMRLGAILFPFKTADGVEIKNGMSLYLIRYTTERDYFTGGHDTCFPALIELNDIEIRLKQPGYLRWEIRESDGYSVDFVGGEGKDYLPFYDRANAIAVLNTRLNEEIKKRTSLFRQTQINLEKLLAIRDKYNPSEAG